MTKIKTVLIGILVAALLLGGLAALSHGVAHTANFWKTGAGLLRVLLQDAEHAVIADSPKTIIAKPDASLDAYMWQNGGYLPVLEKQLGAVVVYRNADGEVSIHCSVNGYFAKWEWLQ